VIQQAPFLPLTKAVYEAIGALNSNNLASGQKEVFEYLAHTYQYVHVPKPNVIRDCLGILFKEGKIYASEDNQYFIYVDSESDRTDGEKKAQELPNVTEKLKGKSQPRCFFCEEEKGSNSPQSRNKQNSRQVDHAHLCEKHKHAQKGGRKSRESNSRDTSMESKEIKQDKKEKKNSSSNDKDKKTKDKATKKTVWGQLTGFMKGKSNDTTKENSSKATNSDKKCIESTSVARPTKTFEATSSFDDSFKENQDDERMTPLGASLNEKQIEQNFQRSRSFNSHTKKRPELARSNSFNTNSTKKKAIDYDMEPQQNENVRASLNYGQHVRHSSSGTDQSFTVSSKTLQKTSEPMAQRNNPCTVGVVRPYTQASRPDGPRNLSRSNSLKETRKMMTSTSSTPTNELQRFSYRADSKQFGSLTPTNEMHRIISGASSKNFTSSTPTGDIQRAVSRDSNRLSSGTLTNEIQRPRDRSSSSTLTSGVYTPVFRDTHMGSLTPNEFERPTMRDPRSVTRSLSLREHRYSDSTPYSSHRAHVNVHREMLSSDSPLKHLLTKNTGNTLPVTANHPRHIPGPTIQDRSRPSTQNRNSFPNATLLQRTSWRAMSKGYDEDDGIGATAKGLLLDDNLKKHDHLFSPIYQHQRMLPCDCSETGYSETSCSKVMSDSTEQKSVSSEHYQSSFLKKYNNDHSTSTYSTSDNGILLDEISSSCSSEIQSIMNHDNKMHTQQSPYTVAKGEVVLDSSLTFIGII